MVLHPLFMDRMWISNIEKSRNFSQNALINATFCKKSQENMNQNSQNCIFLLSKNYILASLLLIIKKNAAMMPLNAGISGRK